MSFYFRCCEAKEIGDVCAQGKFRDLKNFAFDDNFIQRFLEDWRARKNGLRRSTSWITLKKIRHAVLAVAVMFIKVEYRREISVN